MEPLVMGELTIEVHLTSDRRLALGWRGRSNERQPSLFLRPFFDRIARQAQELGVGIELHFERLEYFNSSTITAIIQLIQSLRAQRLKVGVIYDGRVRAQKMSFEALRPLETLDALVTVQDIADTSDT